MNTNWFLGANTAAGFVSRFAQLHPGTRVRKCVIIKGGPGCGKSTFMKNLRTAAERLNADTESYPCSSDPASLDGLFIPALGLAFVDGTAPQAKATNEKTGAFRRLFCQIPFNSAAPSFPFPDARCAVCRRRCSTAAPDR